MYIYVRECVINQENIDVTYKSFGLIYPLCLLTIVNCVNAFIVSNLNCHKVFKGISKKDLINNLNGVNSIRYKLSAFEFRTKGKLYILISVYKNFLLQKKTNRIEFVNTAFLHCHSKKISYKYVTLIA